MKPYYTKKGKYEDGRNKIAIETEKDVKFLPKPEVLIEILKLLGEHYDYIILRAKKLAKFRVNV